MRLVCPNCDAEYEVDASVIPEGGRDVQCSNCGHAWFQVSPELEAEIAAEEALYDAPPALDTQLAAQHPDVLAAFDDTEAPPAAEPPPTAPAAPKAIDASVLAVLAEEAELELNARRAEAPAMEVQTDMALQAPEAAGLGAVARRLARLKGVESASAIASESAKTSTRADAFPEIDEINSTLRASSEKRAGSAAVVDSDTTEKRAGRGFRSGFILMLILAVLIVAVYVMAPKLAEQFPDHAGALNGYVSMVDTARALLDGLLKSAITFLRGLSGGAA